MGPEQEIAAVIDVEDDIRVAMRDSQQRIEAVVLKHRLQLAEQRHDLSLLAMERTLNTSSVGRKAVTCRKKHTPHGNQHNKTYYLLQFFHFRLQSYKKNRNFASKIEEIFVWVHYLLHYC